MASDKKTCRVCGKEYEPCRTANRNPNVFHWQEVACSPECGATYLRQIIESRKPTETNRKSKPKKTVQQTETVPVNVESSVAIADEEATGVVRDVPVNDE